MRRDRAAEADTVGENLLFAAGREAAHFGGIVILLDAGLDRLPVPQGRLGTIPVHQRGAGYRFSDPGIGAGYKEAAEHTAASSRAPANTATKASRVASERSEWIESR